MAFFTGRVTPVEAASTRNRARVMPAPQEAVRMPGFMAEADLPEADLAMPYIFSTIPQKLEEITQFIEQGGAITAFDTSELSLFFKEALEMDTTYSNTLLDRLLRSLQQSGQLFRFNPDGSIEDMNDIIGMFDPEVHQKLLEFVIRNNIHRTQAREEGRSRAASREDSEGALTVFPDRSSEEFEVEPLSVFFPRDMRSRSRSSDTVGSGIHYKAKYTRPPMIYGHRTKPRVK